MIQYVIFIKSFFYSDLPFESCSTPHECDFTSMDKKRCGEFMLKNLHDFYSLMCHRRVTHAFLDTMMKKYGIHRDSIPEFFLYPKLRQSLTSIHLSSFEWLVISNCTNKMF